MIAGIPKKTTESKMPAEPAHLPRPRRALHLAPEQGRYEQTYRHYRARFLEQLGGLTHARLRMQHIYRPGVDGRPVPDASGYVFWRARFVLHAAAEHRAHELMPELYRSFLRRPGEVLAMRSHWTATDEHVLAALLHYACWTGRPTWIYSIAALLHDHGGHNRPDYGPVFELAALQAAGESISGPGAPNPRCDFYARLVARPDPYFSYCLQLLRGRRAPGESAARSKTDKTDETFSVKRLLWAEAAATADDTTEKYLLRRRTKNPPVDEDDLMDLYRSLAMRGKLHRAVRLLLRHNRLFGEKISAVRVVLQIYLNNGKYLHYLRRLRLSETWPGRRAFYEALYCIHRLGAQDREDTLMTQLMAGKQELKLPPDELRYRMRTALEVARSGHPAVLGASREEWGDLVENHYLLEAAARARGKLDGALIRERFRLYQACVSDLMEGTTEQPRNLQRTAFYFRTLLWTFEQYRDRSELEPVWPILRPLAGENLAVRSFFGVMHFERDQLELARRHIADQAGFQPALMHARSELALADQDFAGAERIYRRLLVFFPDSATLLFNLGLILERAYRIDEAVVVFRRVLELEPRHQAAYDRIQLLT